MSSASVMINKSFGLSSACSSFMEIDNQELVVKKQGIVAILGSDVVLERSRAASLRRTLSADMSSKKWLAQNGFSPMKKIASSEELSMAVIPADSSFSSLLEGGEEEEEEYHRRRRHIWSCSVRDENNDKEVEKPGQFDIWSSIISQKANDLEASKSPPYIHPLVKRSASTLSENSLKICTESLGSETGSDGFSSYPASETSSDVEVVSEEKEEDQQSDHLKQTQIISDIGEDYHPAVKFNNHHIHGGSAGGGAGGSTRKSVLVPPRSFPPPIPSLSPSDGPSLRMQTRRGNGRLVLEAVSIPNSQRNFRAERQDGRLVLTFLNSTITTTSPVVADDDDYQEKKIIDNNDEEFDEKFMNFDEEEKGKMDDDDDEEEEIDDDDDDEEIEIEVEKENGMREIEIQMEEAPKLSSRVINFHRLALVMDNNNKPIGLANMKQAWPRKFNEAAATAIKKLEEDDHHHHLKQMVPTAQSLPPRPPPAAARMIPSSPAAAAAVNAATGAAASFNAYEYYWRGSNSTATTTHHLALKPLERNTNTLVISNNELMANHEDGRHHEHHQKLVVLRGNKADYLVPFLKGCKKPISCTSLLFWEPHCIATS